MNINGNTNTNVFFYSKSARHEATLNSIFPGVFYVCVYFPVMFVIRKLPNLSTTRPDPSLCDSTFKIQHQWKMNLFAEGDPNLRSTFFFIFFLSFIVIYFHFQ